MEADVYYIMSLFKEKKDPTQNLSNEERETLIRKRLEEMVADYRKAQTVSFQKKLEELAKSLN